jgi:SOS response regulatory protein OraA/RecX
MPEPIRITSLKPHGDQYSLGVSCLEQPVAISAALVFRHRLKEGIVITRPQFEQLMAEVADGLCEREVARMLAYREHSCGEIREKLRQKQIQADVAARVIEQYRRNGLIDDARYAQNLVRRVFEQKAVWKAYLVAQLMAKHVGRDLAEQTVADFLADKDETEVAVAALQRKRRELADKDIETARQKAYTYLSRRGIGYAAARAAFDTVYSRTDEDADA